MKTIGREPDVTPICTNTTLSPITLLVCKIRTEMSGGEECRLLYRYGQDFENQCDSRFTLMMVNQTVFLHLTSLTPVDSGNHTCECTHPEGTYILHLNITVEGKPIYFSLILWLNLIKAYNNEFFEKSKLILFLLPLIHNYKQLT